MSAANGADRNDWGPWVLVPEDGQPYYEPRADRDITYRPRLIAPEHPTLRVKHGYIGTESQIFDLDGFIDAAKIVRQLMKLAHFTADDRALAGFLNAVADCLDWWTELTDGQTRGGWYGRSQPDDPVVSARNRGWDRLPPVVYDWVEPAKVWPGRPAWGEWTLDDQAMILDGADDRQVDLFECRTAESIVRQLLSLASTAGPATLGGLIRAVDDVVSPGSWRRPFGADQGIGIDDVASRVDHYVEGMRGFRRPPEWSERALMDVTLSPRKGADLLGAWRGRVDDAILSRRLPCLRVGELVRVHEDDLRQWASRPDTELGLPPELADWSRRQNEVRKGEAACMTAAWELLASASPWTGTQAELHDAITPDPQPPGWPAAAQLTTILGQQYHPRTGGVRMQSPQPRYTIERIGKQHGRNIYRITALSKSGQPVDRD